MKIHWSRVLIIALCSELMSFAVYVLAQKYARTVLKPLALLDFFVVMFLAGLWVTRRIRSRSLLHATLVGFFACIIYLVSYLPWIMHGIAPEDFGIGALQAFGIMVPGSALGGYFGRYLLRRHHH